MPGVQADKQEKHRNPVRTPLRNRQETRFFAIVHTFGRLRKLDIAYHARKM